jgi:probable F420-dependent oxidoreductase
MMSSEMKFTTTLPLPESGGMETFLQADVLSEMAKALERAGFDSCSVTDHPCPTGRWLDAGGHHAQDPFVLLSFIAAATRNLRLQTGILVLPYRNPFLTARAVASLDVCSGGRVILGVGTGYLKGEYRALGVDFMRRNEFMDEYIRAMKAAWGADEFTFEGSGYKAVGNRVLPRPVQRPHPPIWIGGNSKRAIRRAVEWGDGWMPFFTPGAMATTSRTARLIDLNEFADTMTYLREYCGQIGRERPPELILGGVGPEAGAWNPEAILDQIAQYERLGVSHIGLNVGGKSFSEWRDNVERYGSDIIAKMNPTK